LKPPNLLRIKGKKNQSAKKPETSNIEEMKMRAILKTLCFIIIASFQLYL
jgi:hypothetical protein